MSKCIHPPNVLHPALMKTNCNLTQLRRQELKIFVRSMSCWDLPPSISKWWLPGFQYPVAVLTTKTEVKGLFTSCVPPRNKPRSLGPSFPQCPGLPNHISSAIVPRRLRPCVHGSRTSSRIVFSCSWIFFTGSALVLRMFPEVLVWWSLVYFFKVVPGNRSTYQCFVETVLVH